MKTKIFILLAFLAMFGNGVKAQNVIALQHGNTNSIFSTFDSAMTAAVNGDYIYLPGGTNMYSDMNINKGVHIIGAGHYPDSTLATYYTTVVGNCNINTGSDNGSIEGIYFTGSVNFNNAIFTYTISRCNFGSITLSPGMTELTVKECVINGGVNGNNAQNILFSNNIIGGQISNFLNNAAFKNNFLEFSGVWYWNTTDQSYEQRGFEYDVFGVLIENNEIYSSGDLSSNNSNIYNNNIFINQPNTYLGLEQQSNNLFQIPLLSIFANVSSTTFSYTQDYHLAAGSPAIGAGTNGTDIGIYGGTYPWKEGSVPMNPHIQTKTIGTTTNINGDLPVNIQVGAQDH